ncbi:hypothetical protein NDU88_007563 [Pleurodeles waltl]|uniref:Uncharacterized protein n=1 Tax=Pleurodeles waltl TaxID=8319 RepID=A0AAV7VQU6_PLEWA|nr:hypothetical protein NDU88_007563 [Pleurodeles waltl]
MAERMGAFSRALLPGPGKALRRDPVWLLARVVPGRCVVCPEIWRAYSQAGLASRWPGPWIGSQWWGRLDLGLPLVMTGALDCGPRRKQSAGLQQLWYCGGSRGRTRPRPVAPGGRRKRTAPPEEASGAVGAWPPCVVVSEEASRIAALAP